jgi:hypothetical protein
MNTPLADAVKRLKAADAAATALGTARRVSPT